MNKSDFVDLDALAVVAFIVFWMDALATAMTGTRTDVAAMSIGGSPIMTMILTFVGLRAIRRQRSGDREPPPYLLQLRLTPLICAPVALMLLRESVGYLQDARWLLRFAAVGAAASLDRTLVRLGKP